MKTPGRSPLDVLFQAPVLIAVLMAGEALALIMALASDATGRLIQFGLASLGIQWVSLATLCILYLLRRQLARLPPPYLAWLCLAFLLCMTTLVASAAWSVFEMSTNAMEGRTTFVLRMLAIAAIVGLLMLLTYQNYWNARQLAIRAKQLELEALQARIRPHFLFNTLNTGAALVHQRPEEAERLLLDLSDLFRAALAGPREISLADELSLVRRYLEIESLRFGNRLRVEWRLPESLPALVVPALSIQPLVENAIRHGVEPAAGGGDVSVEVACGEGFVQITVANGLPTAPVRPTAGHQVGLSSVRARIQAMTQGRGSVETQAKDGRYTAVLRLPMP
ncbi:MAG: histidine kinase [Pseudoxanthomonas sp.]